MASQRMIWPEIDRIRENIESEADTVKSKYDEANELITEAIGNSGKDLIGYTGADFQKKWNDYYGHLPEFIHSIKVQCKNIEIMKQNSIENDQAGANIGTFNG